MEIEQYIKQKKEFYNVFMTHIDDEKDHQENFTNLITYMQTNKILDNREELKNFLTLLSRICLNHHYYNDFQDKIFSIFTYLREQIKKTFTRSQITSIFKSYMQASFFIYDNQILKEEDDDIYSLDIDDINSNLIQIFQKDSFNEFISLIDETGLDLNSSIYYNLKYYSFIEFSILNKSNSIIQYLTNKGIEFTESLLLFAIQVNNLEVIHLFEKNQIDPDKKCLKEAIKCHHNKIAHYIIENYKETIDDNFLFSCFHYHNYEFFPLIFNDDKFILYYLCKYNYVELVKPFLKTTKIDINELIEISLFNLLIALKKDNFEIVNLLLTNIKTEIKSGHFNGCTNLEEITIPSSITFIGSNAFSNCENLVRVTLPSLITTIGDNAFNKCSRLKEIKIPSSVKVICNSAFSYCYCLNELIFEAHSSLEKIGDYAFYSTDLKKLNIPSSVKIIGESAFSDCTEINELIFETPSSLEKIDQKAFSGCKSLSILNIPPSVKSIGKSAFQFCSSIVEFTIPSSVEMIYEHTFCQCSKLSKIDIPSSVKSIGEYAFDRCSSLIQILIHSSVTSIGTGAFASCEKLKEITIPSSVQLIDQHAFENCYSLEKITIPSSIVKIFPNSFRNCTNLTQIQVSKEKVENVKIYTIQENSNQTSKCLLYKSDQQSDIFDVLGIVLNDIENIKIPSFITKIDEESFALCNKIKGIQFDKDSKLEIIGQNAFSRIPIKSILIPSNVKEIGKGSFYECHKLTNVIFEEDSKLEKISYQAFQDSKIESIYLPSSLKIIDEYAFYCCHNLKNLHFNEGSQLEIISSYAFNVDPIEKVLFPSNLKIIGECAFDKCYDLKYIQFANDSKLELIDNLAFFNTRIECIAIPSSVKKIESFAFGRCNNLKIAEISENSLLEKLLDSVFNESNNVIICMPSNIQIEEDKEAQRKYGYYYFTDVD